MPPTPNSESARCRVRSLRRITLTVFPRICSSAWRRLERRYSSASFQKRGVISRLNQTMPAKKSPAAAMRAMMPMKIRRLPWASRAAARWTASPGCRRRQAARCNGCAAGRAARTGRCTPSARGRRRARRCPRDPSRSSAMPAPSSTILCADKDADMRRRSVKGGRTALWGDNACGRRWTFGGAAAAGRSVAIRPM